MRYFVMNFHGHDWIEVKKEVHAESGISPILTSNNATMNKDGYVSLAISEPILLASLDQLRSLMNSTKTM